DQRSAQPLQFVPFSLHREQIFQELYPGRRVTGHWTNGCRGVEIDGTRRPVSHDPAVNVWSVTQACCPPIVGALEQLRSPTHMTEWSHHPIELVQGVVDLGHFLTDKGVRLLDPCPEG